MWPSAMWCLFGGQAARWGSGGTKLSCGGALLQLNVGARPMSDWSLSVKGIRDSSSRNVWKPDGLFLGAVSPKRANRCTMRYRASWTRSLRSLGASRIPRTPSFFDPNCDEPVPMRPESEAQNWAELYRVAQEAGLDPAYIRAWEELGYIVTEMNQHLF